MGTEQVSGWPVVRMQAEHLRREPVALLRWVSSHRDCFSLVVDARGGVMPPELALGGELEMALARCVRVAVCVGKAAAVGIIWHHRLRDVGEVERRLFVDFQRGVHWASEPHAQRSRQSWVSMAPPLRPSVL